MIFTQVEQDFVHFMVQRRDVSYHEIEETYLRARERFKFATSDYRDLCGTVHSLFDVVYGEASETELITSYQFHATLHLFRFLSYSYETPPAFLNANFNQQAQSLAGLIEEKPIVVDYGCGLGYISFMIGTLYPNSKIYLVDIDCIMLDFALFRFRKYHIDVDSVLVTESNIYPELPIHNICIAEEVMEHLVRPIAAYQNIYKSLKRGGILTGGFHDHGREFFHVSPGLRELRESIARDFESIGNRCYRKI